MKLRQLIRDKRHFTIEEVRKHASELRLQTVTCVQWLKQRGVVVEETKTTSHLSLATQKLLKRRRSRFFESLPYEQKMALLKKFHKSFKYSTRSIREIATKLNIPELQLTNWVRHNKRRYLSRDRLLTDATIEILTEEYKKCDYWDEENILLLANQLNVSLPLIKNWYSDKRSMDDSNKKIVTPSTDEVEQCKGRGTSEKRSMFKTSWQKNILFEEFKKSPGAVTSETLSKLVKATSLSTMQISKWLSCLRVKWSQSNEATIRKNLIRDFNQEKLKILEKQYRMCRFLDKDVVLQLKKSTALHQFSMKGWFSNRRIYEVLTNDKDLVHIDHPKNEIVEDSVVHQPKYEEPLSIAIKNENKMFFDSLSKNQKQRLMKSVNYYNLSYKRLAHSLNLPIDQVRNWMKWRRELNDNLKVPNKITFPDHIIRALKAAYEESNTISKNQTIALANELKLKPIQVTNWFVRRRRRERQRNAAEMNTQQVISDAPPQCSPVHSKHESDDEEKETTEPDGGVLAQQVLLPGKRYYKNTFQKNILYDEYKKSRELPPSRLDALSNRLRLTRTQVSIWFRNFHQRYVEKSDENIQKIVETDAIGVDKLAKLQAEYRKNRYISEKKIEQLAKQFELGAAFVKKWFTYARWYELRFGHAPGANSKLVLVENSSPCATAARLKLGTSRITKKKLQILKKEFQKDEIMTNERARILCPKVKLTMDRIKMWFENRRKLKTEEQESENVSDSPNINLVVPKIISTVTSAALETDEFAVSSDIVAENVPNENAKFSPSKLQTVGQSILQENEKNYSCKMPAQQNRLFEEFKTSSSLPSHRLAKLTEELGLSSKQISAWFHWMRSKLHSLSKQGLDENYCNRNLNREQIDTLESEYEQNRYISRERREELSASLYLSKGAIKTWFANRRYYEILSDDSKSSSKIDASTKFEEDSETGLETVIDYDWEDGNDTTVLIKSETNNTSNFEHEIEDIPVNSDLENDFCEFTPDDIGLTTTQEDVFEEYDNVSDEELSNSHFQERERFVTRLGPNLEPINQDVEKLFWYMNSTPNRSDESLYSEIDESRNHSFDLEFQKNPWPTLDKITRLSKKLNVSEPKIHWWFMKKRCFLTKTILTVPPSSQKSTKSSKRILIDLTEDEAQNASNSINSKSNAPEPEFVALNDSEIKSEDLFVDESFETDQNTSLSGPNSQDAQSDGDETSKICENNLNPSPDFTKSSVSDTTQNTTVSKNTQPASLTENSNKKKPKIHLTSHQRAILLREFKRCKFISATKARLLAQDLSLSATKVDSWFEYMRNNAEKKTNPAEKAPVSLKNLTPATIESLEAEFRRSQNLSEKRTKLIALKLNISKKVVRKWFFERLKTKDD